MHGSPISKALALACAGFALGPASRALADEAFKGSAYSSLGPEDLALRFSAEGDIGYAKAGLEAKGEQWALEAATRLQSSSGMLLIAGPGSTSGLARLLVDPVSPTALTRGEPVELDPSLQSRSSVLELGAGPLALFALAKGRGMARLPEAAAAGLECALALPSCGLALVAAASRDGAAAESSGWRPDPWTAPAATVIDPVEPCYSAALAVDRRNRSTAALVALAASYGRLAGPGLALRLESREIIGLFDVSVAASAASPNFRELGGSRLGSLVDASIRARLAMRRASSLEAALETKARGESLLRSPLWGRKGSVRLLFPLGQGSSFDTRIEGERSPEGGAAGSWSAYILSKAVSENGSGSIMLGAIARWLATFSGLELDLETALSGEEGLPTLRLNLSLGMLDAGKAESPVVATGVTSIEVPFGKGSSLALELPLPEKGIVLGPAIDQVTDALLFRLRYRSSFPACPSRRRRPRSRRFGRSKVRSIAQRAAS